MATRFAVVGVAVISIACCVGLPVVTAALGGVTVAAVIGVVAGLITALGVGVGGLLFVQRRRQGASPGARR